jgi:2-keto-3-deoxy-L-rhamnonate aldolase RhmA
MAHQGLAQAWAADRPVFGGWVTTLSPVAIASFANAGYDYVGIDTQHTLLDNHDAGLLLQPLVASPVAAIVRVAKNDSALIGKVLDAGADGVIVPMVQNAEEAATAAAACRYMPDGIRSLGPMRPEMGRDVATLQDRVTLFVMIESEEAVGNAAEICATPGVGGIYIGPGDLAVSYGKAPGAAFADPPDAQLVGAIEQVCQIATEAGVVPGIHAGSGAMAAIWAARGFRLLSLSSDGQLLAAGAAAELQRARAA